MKYLLFSLIAFSMMVGLYAENPESSLIMLRCDNGFEDAFIGSPEKMDLGELQSNINPASDTVVFVHGFNTSYSSAKDSYTYAHNIFTSELGTSVNHVGFYWPSNTWLDFGTAVKNANETGKYLVHVLQKINQWSNNNTRVHIVCHSLGGRVLLATLNENEARYVRWGKTCLFAAAVDNNSFFGSFAGTNLLAQQNNVYFSKNDDVLKYLYSLYSWLFERGSWKDLEGAEKFENLTIDEKLEYMRKLEDYMRNPKNRGFDTALTEFDLALYEQIQRAEKDAMGLVGAFLGNSKELRKVENIEVSNIVNGHSYWNNAQVLRMGAQKLK